jgi:hypothetical protein
MTPGELLAPPRLLRRYPAFAPELRLRSGACLNTLVNAPERTG